MTKGEKNEAAALWVLSEPVRGLMYGRADAPRGAKEVGVAVGLGRGTRADGPQRRGERTERGKRSRHASYVMIIRKHRGRLFSALPGLRGTWLGP